MSIVESVDSEISTVQEEISELEQQLDSKRIRLEGLADLRSRAEALSDPAPTQAQAPRRAKQPKQPQPQVPAKSSTSQGTEDERIDAIVELVGQHPEKGIGAGEIRSSLKLSADQFAALRPRLQSRLRIEGNGRARRYFPEVEAAPRPKPAPARQGRATPAPADSEPRPASAAAEAQYARRGRIAQAIVELVADSEPITGEEIVTMLLEQLPDAERDDVVQTRMRLAREGKIEERAGAYRIPSHQAGPVTQVERDVVACLGSGRTAREVAANVDSVRDAAGARVVLEAMVRRSVLARREGSDPAVYVAVERQALAA